MEKGQDNQIGSYRQTRDELQKRVTGMGKTLGGAFEKHLQGKCVNSWLLIGKLGVGRHQG